MKSLRSKWIFLVAFALFGAGTGFAAFPFGPDHLQVCDYVFRDTGNHDLGLLKDGFRGKFMAEVDESKSFGLPDEPVFNQRQYGCCWLTAEAGEVCRACSVIGKDIRPVDTYLAAISITERALKAPLSRSLVYQGGNAPYAISLINRFGILPEGALVKTAEGLKPWRPIVDFQSGKNGSRLIELINMKLVDYLDLTDQVFVEIKKFAVQEKIDDFYRAIQKFLAVKPGKKKFLEDSFESYRAAVLKILDETIGEIPQSFVYEGKTYTPLEFLKANVPEQSLDMTFVVPEHQGHKISSLNMPRTVDRTWENPDDVEEQAWTSLAGISRDQKWSDIDDAIVRSLHEKKPVMLSIKIKDALIDMEQGLMTIDGFAEYPEFAEEVRRMAAAIPGFTDGGHMVLITKIYRNAAGETIGYRIQNSWGALSSKTGKKIGDQGYFIADTSYMKAFSSGFYFQKGIYPVD
jgi:hypothetical protein